MRCKQPVHRQIIKLESINDFNKNTQKRNPITLSVEDLVLIPNKRRSKQERPYKGPNRITDIHDKNISLLVNNSTKVYHKKSLKSYTQ